MEKLMFFVQFQKYIKYVVSMIYTPIGKMAYNPC